MALINCGAFIALGALSTWHSKLIGKGETSIEANINKAETVRLAELGRVYVNPYNFGKNKNWKIFLGLVQGRYGANSLSKSLFILLNVGILLQDVF